LDDSYLSSWDAEFWPPFLWFHTHASIAQLLLTKAILPRVLRVTQENKKHMKRHQDEIHNMLITKKLEKNVDGGSGGKNKNKTKQIWIE
jgi:hypothetical protein